MAIHEFTFHLAVSVLDNGTRLGRILLYPEATAYENREEEVRT
jgi:hypothetical protein